MPESIQRHARLLIVDDQAANIRLLECTLQEIAGLTLVTTTDSTQALPLYLAVRPDAIVLDLRMPGLDGFAILEQLRPLVPANDYLPILVISADITPDAKLRALALGATEFLSKPYNPREVELRVRKMLEARFLHQQLEIQNQVLEQLVSERTRALEEAQVEILERLALAAEYRDDDTGQHTQRVGHLAALLARELGLSRAQVELIRRAAPLHDVGKIGVPDHILLKPGKLTPEEYAQMKLHTTIGAEILSGGRSELIRTAQQIALTHHERWDGSGYPARLAGDAIPLAGRIVSVADVFDALTHARPYKLAWPVEQAVAEIRRQSGSQFDPVIAAGFLRVQETLGGGQALLEATATFGQPHAVPPYRAAVSA
jgi:putative two-component system response regulator